MTILPLSADDMLSPLRAQLDDLARLLAAPDGATGDAAVLKQRIFLAHKVVEQHAVLLNEMQREVRDLVEGWKSRFGGGAAPTSAPSAARTNGAATGDEASSHLETTTPTGHAEQPGGASDVGDPAVSSHSQTVLEVEFPSAPSSRTDGARLTPVSPPRLTPAASGRHTPSITLTPSRPHAPTPAHGQPRVIDELNASTFVERGWSKIASAEFDEAETALEKALALNPGDPQAETLLGWARMSQGKLDAAMELFEQVLDRAPDFALAHINVAFVHLRRGQYEVAIEHLVHAIALDSDRKATLYGYYYLGLVHLELEQIDDAIAALQRAIELGPNLIEARFVLGRVYWFADRSDEAIATWRMGAEVNKFNPWSSRCLEVLATVADGGAPSRVA